MVLRHAAGVSWGRASGEGERRDGAAVAAWPADGVASPASGARTTGPAAPREAAHDPGIAEGSARERSGGLPRRSGSEPQPRHRLHVDGAWPAGTGGDARHERRTLP